MSNNTTEQEFSAILNTLDLMDEAVANEAVEAVRSGAELIATEQRRLISRRSMKLANLIKPGRIYVTKSSGKTTVQVGYDSAAIKEAPEALVMEFGRPGKTSDGKYKSGRNKGKPIGKVTPTPHIRPGFDNAEAKAGQETLERLWNIASKNF